jgi:hypothetical protein
MPRRARGVVDYIVAELDAGKARLEKGFGAPEWVCYEVLEINPGQTFTEMRKQYRRMVRQCCPHSGMYDPKRYTMLRAAWNCIRLWRR